MKNTTRNATAYLPSSVTSNGFIRENLRQIKISAIISGVIL